MPPSLYSRCVWVPVRSPVKPWFWREGSLDRGHLRPSLLMRPALQVPGELVAMAIGTCCQCSEEEGSRWLLGFWVRGGEPQTRGHLNPKTAASSSVGAQCPAAGWTLQQESNPSTVPLALLSPLHCAWWRSVPCLPHKVLFTVLFLR